MTRGYVRPLGAGLLCAVLIVFGILAAQAHAQTETTFKGTVFVVDNDASGKVIEVSILDTAGEEFFVQHDEVGDQLLKMVDKNVKVTGSVSAKDGKKFIKVSKFEIVAS